jgi:hypothetical protein
MTRYEPNYEPLRTDRDFGLRDPMLLLWIGGLTCRESKHCLSIVCSTWLVGLLILF